MISRRTFLRSAAAAGVGLVGAGSAGVGYGFWEAAHLRVTRETIPVPRLPAAFEGKTIAVVADLHHGPFVGLDFIRHAVELTSSLKPDLIALVGDYAHKGYDDESQLPPCLDALSALKAPFGVYAVPGNHDMLRDGQVYRSEIARTPLTDLTNRNLCVSHGGDRLWVAGIDDLWHGRPDFQKTLAGVPSDAATLILCHNPDFTEDYLDPRVGLVLSGHMHGGQIYVPDVGCSWLPSKYGMKYRQGLVRGPLNSRVFVSRGVGEAGVPLRINSPPEVCLLTLAVETSS